jgi:hypothetical protein
MKYPTRWTIELTNHCNLYCDMCPRRHYKTMPLGLMPLHLYQKIVRQIPEGSTILPFWRGESLVHPFFNAAMHEAKRKGLEIVLATNGTLLCPQTMPADILISLKAVNISIHGVPSLAGAYWILAQREALQSEKPDLQFSMVEGEDDAQPYFENLRKWAVFGDLKNKPTFRVYQEHTIDGVWGKIDDADVIPRDRKWCKRLDTDLVIAWDGSVSRCCYHWQTDPELNANDLTLKEIWAGMEPIRKNYPDEVCAGCDEWQGEGRTI